MAGLLSLPLELLVYVSSFVSTSDLAALRLTCKQTEKSLYEWFSEEFFVKKQFMLTQPSLQALLDISRHSALSKKLKHLIVATTVYDDLPIRFRDSDACSSYMQGYADQRALIDNGIDREMLTEIFKGLVNLETVDVRDFCAKRERDGTYWASWGATTVYKETGVRLRESYRGTGSQSRFVSHVFSNLLYAMGVAGRTPPRFEVLLRQQPAGLPDGAFHLPNFTFPAVQPVLYNLQALFLTLNLSDVSLNIHHTYTDGTPVWTMPGRALRHFLSCTPNLTHLRLNFQKSHVTDSMDFMKWLAAPFTSTSEPPCPTKVTTDELPPVSLAYLQALELGQLDVNRDALLAVIHRFAPKLQRLSLWRVNIEPGPPNHFDSKSNTWARFFRDLASMPELHLVYLKVGGLRQDHRNAEFRTAVGGEEKLESTREHSGHDMKRFVEGLADVIVVEGLAGNFAVNWAPATFTHGDADSEDDDEDMYDDENDDEDEDDDHEDEEDEDED